MTTLTYDLLHLRRRITQQEKSILTAILLCRELEAEYQEKCRELKERQEAEALKEEQRAVVAEAERVIAEASESTGG